MLFVEAAFQIQNNMFQQQQQQQQQQNEDRYGNEIKRRRMDDGSHLKVWRVCEFKYGLKQDANEYNEEDFVCHEEVHFQEEVHHQKEERSTPSPIASKILVARGDHFHRRRLPITPDLYTTSKKGPMIKRRDSLL